MLLLVRPTLMRDFISYMSLDFRTDILLWCNDRFILHQPTIRPDPFFTLKKVHREIQRYFKGTNDYKYAYLFDICKYIYLEYDGDSSFRRFSNRRFPRKYYFDDSNLYYRVSTHIRKDYPEIYFDRTNYYPIIDIEDNEKRKKLFTKLITELEDVSLYNPFRYWKVRDNIVMLKYFGHYDSTKKYLQIE